MNKLPGRQSQYPDHRAHQLGLLTLFLRPQVRRLIAHSPNALVPPLVLLPAISRCSLRLLVAKARRNVVFLQHCQHCPNDWHCLQSLLGVHCWITMTMAMTRSLTRRSPHQHHGGARLTSIHVMVNSLNPWHGVESREKEGESRGEYQVMCTV